MKEVQSLIGKVATLNRFISRATDKCMPFFKVLKKAFQWTNECEEAFAKLKEYLTGLYKVKRVFNKATIATSLSDGRKVVPLLKSV